MKKVVCLLLGVVVGISPAIADVGVDWQNNNVMAVEDPPGTTNPVDRDCYAQLLWTEDTNTYWTPQSGEVSINDTNGTLYGSGAYTAYLLDSYIIPSNNWGTFPSMVNVYNNSNVGGNNINSGWLYSILYSDTNLNYLTTWYYISQFVSASTVWTPPPAPPNPVTMDITAGAVPDPNGFVHMEFQLVPEPVSLALYGVGIVTLIAASRRRKS